MKTTSPSLRFLTLVPLFLLLGCQTLGPAVLIAVSRGAGLAAEYAVRNQPKSRAAFALAEQGLSDLLSTNAIDAAAFQKVLAALPAIEQGMAGPNGDLYLKGAIFFFDIVRGVSYQIVSKPALTQVMTSVRDGLRAGLAYAPPAPPAAALRGVPEPVPVYTPRDHRLAPIVRL